MKPRALENQPVHLFSDLLIHHKGSGLADTVTQGLAEGDIFRTTPLWGIGKQLFFLHEGRTSDLLEAIEAHASSGDGDSVHAVGPRPYPPSEASAVLQRFNAFPSPINRQS